MDGRHSGIRTFPRGAAPGASTPLLALNNANVGALTRVSHAELQHLLDQAFVHARRRDADAFLVAFDETADYASPNFLWFREALRPLRLRRSRRPSRPPRANGGSGRALYEAVIAPAPWPPAATRVVSEVNAEPPNPASDAFHAAMGFAVVGAAKLGPG